MFDEEITIWLNSINDRPIVKAINIGLFEGENYFNVYLIGSNTYDETDDDWACNEDYIPENKYLQLPSSNSLGWEEFQKQIILSVKKYIINFQDFSVLQNTEIVTVGFDDAELVRVK